MVGEDGGAGASGFSSVLGGAGTDGFSSVLGGAGTDVFSSVFGGGGVVGVVAEAQASSSRSNISNAPNNIQDL